jgi:glutaredoxin
MADVIIYTDPSCPHCRQLKQYLQKRHVPFENRDVTRDPDAANELQAMNAPGVPVVRIGEDMIIGFNEERLKTALHSHGVPAS